MFSTPSVAALILLIYIKPQEFIPGLEGLPLLYVFVGLALLGVVLDLRLGHARFDPPPHWPYVLAFVPWCFGTYLLKVGGAGFVPAALELVIVVVLFFVISMGVQSFRSFELVTGAVLAASLFVAGVCFHQGFAPLGCAVQEGGELETLRPDGRPCQRSEDCYEGDAEPGAAYFCEKQGLFGTVSVGQGRVRYRGVLKDPNEVALTIGAALPILMGRVERKATIARTLLFVVGIVIIPWTIIFTKSRGGILVFLAVVGAYFVKRYGLKGAVLGGVLGLPLLVLGGRGGEEAADSSGERTEALSAGMQMFQSNPLIGVGYDQFTDHHILTAHNAYLLAVSELGLPGLVLFLAMVYLSFKICFVAVRRYAGREDAGVARTWAMAMLAAACGVAVGSFFLSFTYHQVLWIYMGLSGALYAVIRRHDPEFLVRLSLLDKALVLVGSVGFVALLKAFLKLKGQ
jgi:hypothetical protein